jgi:hypothetical protein
MHGRAGGIDIVHLYIPNAMSHNLESSPDQPSSSSSLNTNGGFNGIRRNTNNSPAPPVPNLNISSNHAAALQPGSMVSPHMPSGVSTPIGTGSTGQVGNAGGGYMEAKGRGGPPPSPGRAAADQLAGMHISDRREGDGQAGMLNSSSSSSGQFASSGSLSSANNVPGSRDNKGPDYVYFQRNPQQYSTHILQKSTATKMRMELYYKQAVEGVVQRKERRMTLEKSLMSDGGRGMEDWQKAKQLQGLGKRETKSVCYSPRLHVRQSNFKLISRSSIWSSSSFVFPTASFLRLRRTKIGLGDFKTVKVIGKGAFGEVRFNLSFGFAIFLHLFG